MDSNRKKQLKEMYMNSKSTMGVYQIKNLVTQISYIGVTQDLKGTMNGNKFKLDTGNFKDKELQQEWIKYGSDKFEVSILSELDYEEDTTKTDYLEDLLVLRNMITEDITNKKYI